LEAKQSKSIDKNSLNVLGNFSSDKVMETSLPKASISIELIYSALSNVGLPLQLGNPS